ncbi:nucleotidyltransferase domain-containing protein [Aureimonas glaciei]|uniref:Polymerase beta nucleotidyltransferase domain-containing protein n=1 Tax=Aureimonas glaciei TaxID=1776957 RepID=A0A916YBT5_9HYPH|nr:nucleotidyltransferase domain-containing protein [Aureimonas glaciei]GGD38268.1 hypothetical protein GCM10011335_46240 [Aureimonas glaciei]
MYPAALHIAARNLISATGAHAVILFGSRAAGDAHPDSDWDLAVILPNDITHGQWTPSTLQPLVTGLGQSFHVIAIRKSIYEAARLDPSSMSAEIHRDGLVVAGSPGL